MENQELELFVHAQGAKPQVITAPPSETVRELLVRAGIQDHGDGGLLVRPHDPRVRRQDLDGAAAMNGAC